MRHRVPRPYPGLLYVAKQMRLAPTAPEAKLWSALRRVALGVRWRRQVVLGPYVVDLFAPSVGLVVEIDGGVHAESAERDAARVRALEAMGLRVLRLDARLVAQRLGEAVGLVAEVIAA